MGRITKLFLLGVICYLLFVNTVFADTSCKPIYGGGPTCTSSTQIAPDKKILIPPASNFPVLNPPVVSKSPATGPEALALFSLIPIGIAGFFLRRKSKRQLSL